MLTDRHKRMLFKSAIFLSVAATGMSLMCKMCDGYVSCANEMSEHCPPHSQCYTIKRHGTVTHKGCAMSCAALPYAVADAHCTTCNHRDNCNDEKSIGGGVQPKHYSNGGHHSNIGGGVRPNSSPNSFINTLIFFGIAAIVFY